MTNLKITDFNNKHYSSKKQAFTMIELVFGIIIIGALSYLAIPKLIIVKSDAYVSTLRSDIEAILRSIPSRIVAENLDATQDNPNGKQTWGEWIMDTVSLDKTRWMATKQGVIPGIYNNGYNHPKNVICGSKLKAPIYINTNNATLNFESKKIIAQNNNKAECEQLRNSYNKNANKLIPLSSKQVSF